MPTRSFTRLLSVVAFLVAAGSLTVPAFAQKGGVDENDKYPAKPLNELDQRRQDVSDAYGETRVPPDEITPRVVYGADDRRDVYEIGAGESVIQGLQQGVC